MSARPSKAVVFDYYFTLAEPTLTDFAALAEELACVADQDEIARHRRELLAVRPLTTPVFDGQTDPFRTFGDYWRAFGEDLFERLGVTGGGSAYAANRSAAHQAAVLYPDVLPALDRLRDRGVLTAVLSDADREYLDANITGCGMRFDAVVCSEDLACYKPHRSCFEEVCSRLGVAPEDATYVGDTPLNDVEGGRRAGMRAVWLNRRGLEWPADLEPPELVITSLADLPELLER